MFVLQLASILLATPVGVPSPATATAPVVPASVVDSTDEDILITAARLTHYIAVEQALGQYWQAPEHAALLKTAKAGGRSAAVVQGDMDLKVVVYNYPKLVKKDAGLAAIFTRNHLTPAQFGPTHIAVYQALAALDLTENSGATLPEGRDVLGKNVTLVKAHRQELAAVGVTVNLNGGGMGGMGGNSDDVKP